jgi:hypothetical protein
MAMPVRQQVQSVLWFVIAMGCFVLITCPSFMLFMGWTSAIPLAEANERFPGQIDTDWDGVAVYHGRPHEWGLGTIAENPVGFIACSVVLGLALACSMYGMYRSHQLSRERRGEADQPAPQQ